MRNSLWIPETMASGTEQIGENSTTWCQSLAVHFEGSEALEGSLKYV